MQAVPSLPTSILVVDSNPKTLSQMSAVLAGVGYEVRCAVDGSSARSSARMHRPDLLLCDLHLGLESGLELARGLRREPGLEEMAVMFVSSTQLPDVIRRVYDTGGTYYLRQPVDPNVLLELIDRAVWMPHLVNSRISSSHAAFAPHLDATLVAVAAH